MACERVSRLRAHPCATPANDDGGAAALPPELEPLADALAELLFAELMRPAASRADDAPVGDATREVG